jgi:hypothetical protein
MDIVGLEISSRWAAAAALLFTGCVTSADVGGKPHDDATGTGSESTGSPIDPTSGEAPTTGEDDDAPSSESESSSSGGETIGFSCGDPLWLTVTEPEAEYGGLSLGASDSFVAFGSTSGEALWIRYGLDGAAGLSATYPGPFGATMTGFGVDAGDRVLGLVEEAVEFVPNDAEGMYLRHRWLGSYAADGSEEWTIDFGTEPDVEFRPRDVVVADDGTAIAAGSIVGGEGTHLRAFDPDGAVLWDADHPGTLWLRDVDDAGVVVALDNSERVVGIGTDGSLAWSVALDVQNANDATAVGDSVYVSGKGDHSLYIARIGTDGIVAWEDTERVYDGFDGAGAIAVAADGRVAVVGGTQQDNRFPSFLRILSADGTILRTDECAIDDGGGSTETRLNDVAFDSAGNVIAVGSADVDQVYHAVVVAWAP